MESDHSGWCTSNFIQLLRDLDETAWDQFYLNFSYDLKSKAIIFLISKQIVEDLSDDLIQQTLVTVVEKINEFEVKDNPTKFLHWVIKIMDNHAKNFAASRRRKKDDEYFDEEVQMVDNSSTEVTNKLEDTHIDAEAIN